MKGKKAPIITRNMGYSILSYVMLQLTTFFINRSQLLYLSSGNPLYLSIFSSLFPFGFIVGSIINQYLLNTFWKESTYVVFFCLTCIFLLLSCLTTTTSTFWFFRFCYSFCISALIWIFELNLCNDNSEKFSFHKGIIRLSCVRVANVVSAILVGFISVEYYKFIVVSTILLQLTQMFFSFDENKNKKHTLQELFYCIDLFKNTHKQSWAFILFVAVNALNSIYLTWTMMSSSRLIGNTFPKWVLFFFCVGEVSSFYIFRYIRPKVTVVSRIFYGLVYFSIINVLLFVFIKKNYLNGFLILVSLSGVILNKLISDVDSMVYLHSSHINRRDGDFTITVTKRMIDMFAPLVALFVGFFLNQVIFLPIFIFCLLLSLWWLIKEPNIDHNLNSLPGSGTTSNK